MEECLTANEHSLNVYWGSQFAAYIYPLYVSSAPTFSAGLGVVHREFEISPEIPPWQSIAVPIHDAVLTVNPPVVIQFRGRATGAHASRNNYCWADENIVGSA